MGTIVLIVWHDAHSVASTWIDVGDIDSEPAVVESVGFLLADAKPKHIVLAQSLTDNDGDHILAVPVEMVRSMKVLL
tara:strand:- start:500 stop:730 length:231 start_codon:yes stop_codon:yes gene_type:complete